MADLPFMILLTGYTAVGKSTLGKKLSDKLNIKILHSAEIREKLCLSPRKINSDKIFNFRNNIRSKMDDKVYKELGKKAEELIQTNKSVIIDSGNFLKIRRSRFYNSAFKFNSEVYIIKVLCSNESIIKNRLQNRLKHYSKSAFNEAASFEIYESTKFVMEDPKDDILPSGYKPNIIAFDTATNKVKVINNINNSSRFSLIKNAITS